MRIIIPAKRTRTRILPTPHDSWTYATRFCDYYRAMKAVDPTIKVGAVVIPGEDTYDGHTGR